MDFFACEDRARRHTRWLVGYFVVAVLLIVISLNLVVLGLTSLRIPEERRYRTDRFGHRTELPQVQITPGDRAELVVIVTSVTLIIIFGGCLFKVLQLRSGGRAVAQIMGAVPVAPNISDPQLRVLRDIVEEMSIASGVPVPGVYVLPRERGINAFAAGLTTRDAIICVTQGAVSQLNRDELQGVIAHEFSHILNGDMALDLKLVGALFGILLIGLMGYGMLRVVGGASSRDTKDSGGLVIALLVLGLGLTAIGFIGLFFGKLIQAAVCRQREYLADAAAVQFTRNPQGLAGALRKLGALGSRSRIDDHNAEQIAHMFFASSMGIEWGGLSTHPPLDKRIRALDPAWDGHFVPPPGPTTLERFSANRVDSEALMPPIAIGAGAIVTSCGMPRARHIEWASDFLSSVPPVIDHAARDPFSARALVFALLLSEKPEVRQTQMSALRQATDAAALDAMGKLQEPVAQLGSRARRVLLDLAIPALRHLSAAQLQQFRQAVDSVIRCEHQVSAFEYMLHVILMRSLIDPNSPPRVTQPIYFAFKPLLEDMLVLLSALARADQKPPEQVQAAFRAGLARLELSGQFDLLNPTMQQIDASLQKLMQSSAGVKRRFVNAAAHCVAADGIVQTEEAELLRAITTALDCPLPPLLADHAAAPAEAAVT